jgi:hypothetical protein
MAILLMVIDGYYIGGYWCLLMIIILMAIILMIIDGYYIGEYWCLLMIIILMAIGGYSID